MADDWKCREVTGQPKHRPQERDRKPPDVSWAMHLLRVNEYNALLCKQFPLGFYHRESTHLRLLSLWMPYSKLKRLSTKFYESVQLLGFADDINIIGLSSRAVCCAFSRLGKEAKPMGMVAKEDKTKYRLSSNKQLVHLPFALCHCYAMDIPWVALGQGGQYELYEIYSDEWIDSSNPT